QGSIDYSYDGLEKAVEQIGESGPWIWFIFILVSMPGVFNIWHLTSYVFLGKALPHWCKVPELINANWTSEQIRKISSPTGTSDDSCSMFNWNYTHLAQITYEEALHYTSINPKPDLYECDSWDYEGNGVVSEFNKK
ncbi:hypothetical protein C0J52_16091, partial [Blattella germanica]